MVDWKPTASFSVLVQRAKLGREIRCFFDARDVLEVETPLLAHTVGTDPHLSPFFSSYQGFSNTPTTLALQTSPEFAMKRLLANGSGPIYQLGKAFRNEPSGRYHNPEFTMLEWYRPKYLLDDLMAEVEQLLVHVGLKKTCCRMSYRMCFEEFCGINPHTASIETLADVISHYDINIDRISEYSKDDLLNLLLTHVVEPKLKNLGTVFLYDYPASQAALAKIAIQNGFTVAKRFEVYIDGIELANGYHELCDAKEQRTRFENDNRQRREMGQPEIPIDERFLAALETGLPDCSGVALGVDRLLMLLGGYGSIEKVINFPIANS